MRINKKEKKLHSIFVMLLMVSIITASPFLYIRDLPLSASEYTVYAESAERYEVLNGYATAETISKHGNVSISIKQTKMAEAGYEAGDVITLSFMSQQIDIPYCTSYSDVDSGETGLFAVQGKDCVVASINMGNFATTYGIATKSSDTWTMNEDAGDSLKFTVSMKEKGGYYSDVYKVVPKKASLRSIKKKGRVLTVKMSSRPYKRGAAYYQVAYRIKESSKWKYKTAASGTVKIKKLKKGREYIVKVRAYKKVKGIRYYGEWSRTRSVS